MRLSSRPQTGIRQVSKTFRLLYPLEDQLNDFIQKYVSRNNKISSVQIFFDTDANDGDYLKILSLRKGILQVETSLNWEEFSNLNRKDQEDIFIKELYKIAIEVAKKYELNICQIESAFTALIEESK
ncbi:hypothetical protein FZC76_10330 [Sutcliffiella horikoshii]|uniref:Uncharacterized protein n=1 Tax=Sutcliffiella horikoshii TaxID=79883 RepID=A0A5D4SXV4_9BACI|nr:hypothetical protein [Sutcliffiella horikoshii]TYS68135.1 hypothetical protein FZC76_10330 [Sutcliffiella horikoshii]